MNPNEITSDSAGADLMAAVHLAADAVTSIRLIDSQEGFGLYLEWLRQLDESDLALLAVGLTVVAWNCLDDEQYAEFLMRMEIDLPAPSTKVPADQLQTGDWIRLTLDNRTGVDHQLADVHRSGNDVTLMFATAAPITVPRETPVLRTRKGAID